MRDNNSNILYVVYDGDCFFCKRYVWYVKAKELFEQVEVINYRDGGELVRELEGMGYDLNEGMAAKVDGEIYYGEECLRFFSMMVNRRGNGSRSVVHLFMESPKISKLIYPALKLGRLVTLRFTSIFGSNR